VDLKLQISLITGVILYFVVIIFFLKKKTLSLKYSLLWLFSGVIMLILAIFPSIMDWLINFIGIASVTNGLFTISIFMILIILMSLTAILSKMKEQNKKLVQEYALLEKRVREAENRFKGQSKESV